MSGSKDKRERKQKREEGFDLRSPRDKQEEERNKKQKRGAIAFLCVFAVVAIAVLLLNSKMIYRNGTALEINGQSYSVVEYNYYYNASYQYEYTSGYAAYLIDSSKTLSSQAYSYDESITWADHFKESAIENMKNTQMLITEAEAAGMTELDEKYQAQYDTTLENLETTVEESDYATKNAYLSKAYGKGMNYNIYKEILKRECLAQQYSASISDGLEEGYSDSDVETKYEEIANDKDSFTYRMYSVAVATDEDTATTDTTTPDATTSDADAEDTEEEIAAKAEAKAIADNIAAATSEEEFTQLVYENADEENKETYAEDSATLQENVTGSNISSAEYSEWLFDASRQEGDISVIEGESSYYVIYFINRDGHDEVELVNVRHILIAVEEEETDEATVSDTSEEEDEDALTEAETTALAKAEEVLAQWEAGDATEESFGVLADEYSEDTSAGGLYEGVYPGQMTTEFNDWIFDTSRKAGDVEIVKTENFGYHIIYYIGTAGETYRHYLGKTALLEEDYSAWRTEQLEGYTATEKLFMRYGLSNQM